MAKIRTGVLSGRPQSLGLVGSLGIIGAGLDRLILKMQADAASRQIYGMSNPESFDRAMFLAQIGMKMGNAAGANLVNKFVRDHYQYVQAPAIKAIGSVGGKFGDILEGYFKTREDIKRSYGDIGAAMGMGIGMLASRFFKVAKFASLALAGTGVGLPAAIAGFVISSALEFVLGSALSWFGRKAGEKYAEKFGKVDQYSAINLGDALIKRVPEVGEHFNEVKASVVGQPFYKGNFQSYFDTMSRIQESGDVSLEEMGMTVFETGSLYSNISKSLNIKPSLRGSYTKTIGRIQQTTGVDITNDLAGISTGVAMSSTSHSKDIDSTAEAFSTFFGAVFRGGKTSTLKSLELTSSLADMANVYAKRNIQAKNVDKLFSGVQKFTQENMNAEDRPTTDTTMDLVGIMTEIMTSSGIGGDTGTSPLASRITQYADIKGLDTRRGLDGAKFQKMSEALSDMYKFGKGSSIDTKTGVLSLDKRGESAYMRLLIDLTTPKRSGGLGLGAEAAETLAKYIVAFTKNPKLDFSAVKNDPEYAGIFGNLSKVITQDDLNRTIVSTVKISDNYLRLASMFSKEFIDIGDAILNHQGSVTKQIAQGTLDLLVSYTKIVEKNTTGKISDNPLLDEGSSFAPTTGLTTTGTYVTRKDAKIAGGGFKEKIAYAATAAGIDVRTLYAYLGAESDFGRNTANYRDMDYIGTGQIGVKAEQDVNKTLGLHLNRRVERDNILIAAYYIKILRDRLRKFKASAASRGVHLNFNPDDPRVIYAAYNWGIGNLQNYISQTGGFNPAYAPKAETRTGIKNLELSLAGYDYETGVYQARSATSLETTGGTTYTTSTAPKSVGGVRSGGVWHYSQEAKYSGKFSSTTTFLAMSGAGTARGNKTVEYMEKLYVSSVNSADRFYRACAGIANDAMAHASFAVSRNGNAESDLYAWRTGGRARAVMTFAQASREGFQPGDLLYVLGGNHVGIVDYNGTVLQAGTAYDANRKSNLIRTDINEFAYKGWGNIYVVRPSRDANNDGIVTREEVEAEYRAAEASRKKLKASFSNKKVSSSNFLAVASYNEGITRMAVKSKNGLGISSSRASRIKSQEANIEKALGLKASDLTLVTQNVNGGKALNIQINVDLEDVGAVASKILRIVEGIK